jgi:hypothetical protein
MFIITIRIIRIMPAIILFIIIITIRIMPAIILFIIIITILVFDIKLSHASRVAWNKQVGVAAMIDPPDHSSPFIRSCPRASPHLVHVVVAGDGVEWLVGNVCLLFRSGTRNHHGICCIGTASSTRTNTPKRNRPRVRFEQVSEYV